MKKDELITWLKVERAITEADDSSDDRAGHATFLQHIDYLIGIAGDDNVNHLTTTDVNKEDTP